MQVRKILIMATALLGCTVVPVLANDVPGTPTRTGCIIRNRRCDTTGATANLQSCMNQVGIRFNQFSVLLLSCTAQSSVCTQAINAPDQIECIRADGVGALVTTPTLWTGAALCAVDPIASATLTWEECNGGVSR